MNPNCGSRKRRLEARSLAYELLVVHSLPTSAFILLSPSLSIKRPTCACLYQLLVILNAVTAVWGKKWIMTVSWNHCSGVMVLRQCVAPLSRQCLGQTWEHVPGCHSDQRSAAGIQGEDDRDAGDLQGVEESCVTKTMKECL